MPSLIAHVLASLIQQSTMGGTGLNEALVATSAASAVLWTGALIVTQLADGERPAVTKTMNWQFLQFPSRPPAERLRTLEEVQTVCALTMLGFGVFAPIFPLFAQGVWLSVFAAIFLVFYGKTTWQDARFALRIRKHPEILRNDAGDKMQYRKALTQYISVRLLQYGRSLRSCPIPRLSSCCSLAS
jgi:hypothetical protein